MKKMFLATLVIVLPVLLLLPTVTERQSTSTVVHADFVVVEKAKRRMHLMKEGQRVRTYRVALGGNP